MKMAQRLRKFPNFDAPKIIVENWGKIFVLVRHFCTAPEPLSDEVNQIVENMTATNLDKICKPAALTDIEEQFQKSDLRTVDFEKAYFNMLIQEDRPEFRRCDLICEYLDESI